mmetsp:Transcript_67971/g.171398  ORF Transcript_67971/g.171398 Transcript_67971/m.171398 type:complete len:115 (-) Transcript_67971:235-579(-)
MKVRLPLVALIRKRQPLTTTVEESGGGRGFLNKDFLPCPSTVFGRLECSADAPVKGLIDSPGHLAVLAMAVSLGSCGGQVGYLGNSSESTPNFDLTGDLDELWSCDEGECRRLW